MELLQTLTWKKSESLIRPKVLDTTLSETTIYLRRSIEEIVVEESENNSEYVKYVYEEAKIDSSTMPSVGNIDETITNMIRVNAHKMNELALSNKKYISTSIGDFSIKTPTYDFVFCLMVLKDLPNGIPANTIRFYNGTPCGALTQQEVHSLYKEICEAIMAIDSLFTSNKTMIDKATLEELFEMNFVY